ncbi:hypothetical protein JCM14244_07960 [Venenivibrio stagnispumantis]|uniref:Uncharacterized protein n=1 Tax=Venenivibrio stagnispumantis TaxID=407998 RepID=A0AA45WNS5_9AQUI|nr:hypothetical protein SAMN06264868_11914 [Venenivibrio stagnispumantis]
MWFLLGFGAIAILGLLALAGADSNRNCNYYDCWMWRDDNDDYDWLNNNDDDDWW